MDGPWGADLDIGKPLLLGKHSVLQRQRNGCRGWRFKRQIVTRDHTAGDIDQKREPGPLNRQPMPFIDNKHVNACMIHLHNFQRTDSSKLTAHRRYFIARNLWTFPSFEQPFKVDVGNTPFNRSA